MTWLEWHWQLALARRRLRRLVHLTQLSSNHPVDFAYALERAEAAVRHLELNQPQRSPH
ncbi:MAG TPA: hypothetical protein VLL25_16875 [Acidimicrobiales bacterium]|nr:hypothetical protein [Acidimicrobiales bacterium]